MNQLPDFLVVGAPKCGTTWLHQCLSEHPQIFLPRATKELFFFDRYWERGTGWYADYFRGAPSEAVCGEVSPTYFAVPAVPERIRTTIPNARVVVLLRDPVARAVSHYHHLLAKGDTRLPFEEAVQAFPAIREEGYYGRHFARFHDTFDHAQLLPLISEELREAGNDALGPLFRFLGVDDGIVPQSLHQRTYERRTPRGHLLAAVSTRISRALHHAGLHSVVGAIKGLGAGRIVYRSTSAPGSVIEPRHLEAMRADYIADAADLSERIGRDLVRLWKLDQH